MPYSIPLARQLVVAALTAGFLTSCSDEQPRPELPAQPQEQVTTERDETAIAEATAAAVKLILEEDTIVNTRRVSDSCGEPHEGGMAPGFGGPNAVDILPHWAGFLEIGADRPLVTTDASRTSNGYILFTPGAFKETYLMNTDKQVVATHTSPNSNGHSKLLDSGNLLRTDAFDVGQFGWPEGGGIHGCVNESTWDGEILWQAGLTTEEYVQHHDIVVLPNGNFLTNIWIKASNEEAVQAGRNPEHVSARGELWYDAIFEVNPRTHEVVWEWNSANHLVQDFDPEADNYGVVADHPELIDVNKFEPGPDGNAGHDWLHANALDYNAELDQVMISLNHLHEFWIIDHSTTTAEAASQSGGRYGKGGDLLYRWGNPQNYDRGSGEDQQLFFQHNAHWIPQGLSGAGNVLVFNNGHQQSRQWTTVLEIPLPVNEDGSYTIPADAAWEPASPAWEYDPEPPQRFFSWYISGVQRLPNGNTLLNQGAGGRFREVTPDGEIVWEYRHGTDNEPPPAVFRAEWYPEDHPGISALNLEE